MRISNISRCFSKLITVVTITIFLCGCHGSQLTTAAMYVSINTHIEKEPSYLLPRPKNLHIKYELTKPKNKEVTHISFYSCLCDCVITGRRAILLLQQFSKNIKCFRMSSQTTCE